MACLPTFQKHQQQKESITRKPGKSEQIGASSVWVWIRAICQQFEFIAKSSTVTELEVRFKHFYQHFGTKKLCANK